MAHLLRSARTIPIGRVSVAAWLLPLLLTAVASCRGEPAVEQNPEPDPAPETSIESVEPAPNPESPAASEAPAATAENSASPTPAAVVAATPLPNGLLKDWEPASQVLYEFGEMTITADRIQWAEGQSSPYTVVSDDDGYLLNLVAAPSFFDTPHPYIRLNPQSEGGAISEVEVAFYENEATAKQDQYIMFGSYF